MSDIDPAAAPVAADHSDPAPEPAAAPAAATEPVPGPTSPPVHSLVGERVIFVPPVNVLNPLRQVLAAVTAVHGESEAAADVTILTDEGDEYRCTLHAQPVEEPGSGLFAVLEE